MDSHLAAQPFPLMEGEAFRALVEDIRANGLRHPIVLYEDCILDGRNRQRGCEEAGVKPRYEQYKGDDPIGYVVSVNITRRHLNESQRMVVATKLANLPVGRMGGMRKSAHLTQQAAADLLNVSRRGVQDARVVVDRGTPELVRAVEQGDVPVSRAVEIARLTKAQQNDALEQAKHTAPVRTERDGMMSIAIRLVESEVMGLRALCEIGDDQGDPRAREGVRVLRRMAPAVGR